MKERIVFSENDSGKSIGTHLEECSWTSNSYCIQKLITQNV